MVQRASIGSAHGDAGAIPKISSSLNTPPGYWWDVKHAGVAHQMVLLADGVRKDFGGWDPGCFCNRCAGGMGELVGVYWRLIHVRNGVIHCLRMPPFGEDVIRERAVAG